MLIWVVFLGAVLAYIKDEHLSLDILIKAVPKRIAHLMQVLADIGVLYAIYIIVMGGLNLTMNSWDWLSPAAAIPYAYVYLIIPMAGAAVLIMTIFKLIGHIKVLFGIGKETPKEDTQC
jgi:TRAP-type C4-dicarboxylate transport system permease small subunit